jgi:uncharacterized membrane protein
MATVIETATGKELYGTLSNVCLPTETIVPEVRTFWCLDPYFNFETKEFYENATQEEVDTYLNEKRSITIKSAYEQRKLDGWDAYQDFRADMVKEIYDNIITKQQAFIIEDYLGKGYDKIAQQGDWETAYYKLSTTVVAEADAFVQPYLDKAKSIMLAYIQANYSPM